MNESVTEDEPVAATSTARDRIIDVGFEMVATGGLGSLSARSLADRMQTSPSVINYHFGNRDSFVASILGRAVLQAQAWRDRAAGLIGAGAAWTTTADIFLASIQDRLAKARRLQIMLYELTTEAESLVLLSEALRIEAETDHQFWRALAIASGESDPIATLWSDLTAGLLLILSSEEDEAVRSLWICGALRRLSDRIARRRPAEISWPQKPDAASVLQAEAPRSETAAKIIQSALKVIARKGVNRLSQRDVAAMAGVSLASVTYFFHTRTELIAAAFSALHREVRSEILLKVAPEFDPVAWSAQLFDEDGEFTWPVAALRELKIMAARDPVLAPIAKSIRSTRGATSIFLLQHYGVADADPLDAFLWSTILQGITERIRFLPPMERRPTFDRVTKLHSASLFRIGTTP